MEKHKIYTMTFASVYPLYVAKAQRKGRTKEEVDEIIQWLTGFRQEEVDKHLKEGTDFEHFLESAVNFNPLCEKITGVVCGIRVENIEDPVMKKIRYLDKLIDELAKGKSMEKILRT